MKCAEGSVQELVAPENIRIGDSSTATTLKKKTSDNTKSMAMNLCYIFFGICSIVCHLTSFHIQIFPHVSLYILILVELDVPSM